MALTPLFLNQCFDKNRLKNLITWSLLTVGERRTIETVENLKTLGFQFATQAGVSLSVDDLKIPLEKPSLVSQASQQVEAAQQAYQRGNLTAIEKLQQLVDTWHRTSETLKQTVVNHFQSTDKLSPVYMMAFSGARGNISQVRQLAGMRGLMADPQGQIIGFPIRSNFREGLTLTEYMISCYGARKGLVDTALRTADAGYLTRRLVDVSQHMIVKAATCATRRGIVLKDLRSSTKVVLPLRERLIGRVLAEDVTEFAEVAREAHDLSLSASPVSNGSASPLAAFIGLSGARADSQGPSGGWADPTGAEGGPPTPGRFAERGRFQGRLAERAAIEPLTQPGQGIRQLPPIGKQDTLFGASPDLAQPGLLAYRNQEISARLASRIASCRESVVVRSPLTCSIRHGVCQLCYGWSLSEGHLVTLGEAVGIIAAQSIGEPGTQLTMRTFHTGGVFSGDVMAEIRAPHDGVVGFPQPLQGLLVRTSHGKIAFLTKAPGELLLGQGQGPEGAPAPFCIAEQCSHKEDHPFSETSNTCEARPTRGGDRNLAVAEKKTLFSLESLTVLFVRQHERVARTQLLAEFSSLGTEMNETVEAKRTLFSEIVGQVSFANVSVGTRLRESGNILQVSRALGFIWILSGRRSPVIPLLAIYRKGSHLVNEESLLARVAREQGWQKTVPIIKRNSSNTHGHAKVLLLGRDRSPVSKNASSHIGLAERGYRGVGHPPRLLGAPSLATPSFVRDHSQAAFPTGLRFLPDLGCWAISSLPGGEKRRAIARFGPRSVRLAPTGPGPGGQLNALSTLSSDQSGTRQGELQGQRRQGRRCRLSPTSMAAPDCLLLGSFPLWSAFQGQEDHKRFTWAGFRSLSGGGLTGLTGAGLTGGGLPWERARSAKRPEDGARSTKRPGDGARSAKRPGDGAPAPVRPAPVRPAPVRPAPGCFDERARTASKPPVGGRGAKDETLGNNPDFYWFPGEHRSGHTGLAWIDSRYIAKQFVQGEVIWIDERTLRCNVARTPQAYLEQWPTRGSGLASLEGPPKTPQGLPSVVRPVGWAHSQGRSAERAPRVIDRMAVEPSSPSRAFDRQAVLLNRCPSNPIVLQGQQGGGPLVKTSTNLQGIWDGPPIEASGLAKLCSLNLRELSGKSLLAGPCGGLSDNVARSHHSGSVPSKRYWSKVVDLSKQELLGIQVQHFWGVDRDWKDRLNTHIRIVKELAGEGPRLLNGPISNRQLSPTTLSTNPLAKTSALGSQQEARLEHKSQPGPGNVSETDEKDAARLAATSLELATTAAPGTAPEGRERQWGTADPLKNAQAFGLALTALVGGLNRRQGQMRETTEQRLDRLSLQMKPGWVYWPNEQSNLIGVHESIQFCGASAFDNLFFEPALPYFEAFKSGEFSYSSADSPLSASLRIQLQELSLMRTGLGKHRTEKGENVTIATRDSLFQHLATQAMDAQTGSREGGASFYTNKWASHAPASNLNGFNEWHLRTHVEDKPRICPFGQEILLFLRKMLWLPQDRTSLLTGFGVRGSFLQALLQKRVELRDVAAHYPSNPQANLYQMLFLRNLANREPFLWLRAFPVQLKVVTNPRARYLGMAPWSRNRGNQVPSGHTGDLPGLNGVKQAQSLRALQRQLRQGLERANTKPSEALIETKRCLERGSMPLVQAEFVFPYGFLFGLADKCLLDSSQLCPLEGSTCTGPPSLHKPSTATWLSVSRIVRAAWPATPHGSFAQATSGPIRQGSGRMEGGAMEVREPLNRPSGAMDPSSRTSNLSSGTTFGEGPEGAPAPFCIALQCNPKEDRPFSETPSSCGAWEVPQASRTQAGDGGSSKALWLRHGPPPVPQLGKSCFFGPSLAKPSLLVLIRKGYRYPLSMLEKSKAIFLRRHTLAKISANKGSSGLLPPSLAGNSFAFWTKQSLTPLISSSHGIRCSLMPLVPFESFQTAFLPNPAHWIRFAGRLYPAPCRDDGKLQPQSRTRGAGSTPDSASLRTWGLRHLAIDELVPLLSPSVGEMASQRCFNARGGEEAKSSNGGNLQQQPKWQKAASQAGRNVLFTQADHASFASKGCNPKTCVGEFVSIGEEIASGYATPTSGQVVAIEEEKITLRRTQALLFYAQGVMHVNHGEWVERNAPILTLTYQKLVTGDIVQGIPKIEQFFEAPATKEGEPLPNSLQARLRRSFQRLKQRYPVPQAVKRSLEEIQQILVEGILKVYLSQGVRIADKHLEIVIRQMTSKGQVLDVGNTGLFQGEHVRLDRIELVNLATYGEKANYEPAVLGITQASLDSDSFISAASFQETTRVLSRDTIIGKTDFLRGLKERVVLGDLIQAGTGVDDNINYGLLFGIAPAYHPGGSAASSRA